MVIRHVVVAIRYNQCSSGARPWYDDKERHARSIVSCATSCAS
jgi:hypothetical protein